MARSTTRLGRQTGTSNGGNRRLHGSSTSIWTILAGNWAIGQLELGQDAERHVTRASAKSEAVSPLSFTAQPLTACLHWDCRVSLGFLPFYPHCLANRSLLSPDFCLLHPCIIIGVCGSGVFTGLLFLSCFSTLSSHSRLPPPDSPLDPCCSLSILPLSLPLFSFLLSPVPFLPSRPPFLLLSTSLLDLSIG